MAPPFLEIQPEGPKSMSIICLKFRSICVPIFVISVAFLVVLLLRVELGVNFGGARDSDMTHRSTLFLAIILKHPAK